MIKHGLNIEKRVMPVKRIIRVDMANKIIKDLLRRRLRPGKSRGNKGPQHF
jgi:hypothetical protein